jgi:transposase-like protein
MKRRNPQPSTSGEPAPKTPPVYGRRSTPEQRKAAIERIKKGEPITQVAKDIGFNNSTVSVWWHDYQKTKEVGELKPKSLRTTPEANARLIRIVRRNPHLTLKEAMEYAKYPCSEQTAKRKLKEVGITIKTEYGLVFRDSEPPKIDVVIPNTDSESDYSD